MSAWKEFERRSAQLIDGKRFWSNSGESLDIEGPELIGQCKLVKTLSLNALTILCEKMAGQSKIGVVCTKVRRGCGQGSEPVISMTFGEFLRLRELWTGQGGGDACGRGG
jgi:hypothetical protein